MTVFLVDDEAAVRKAVSRLLLAEGFTVAAFASPEEFLASHDPATPGCLVLDMAMPGASGLDVQEALAARGSMLPIIFLTGRSDVPMCAQAMKRGAVDFLTKPVRDTGNLHVRFDEGESLPGGHWRSRLSLRLGLSTRPTEVST
jgi:FixJ family two-component response regulator